jgi:hypothetical protein
VKSSKRRHRREQRGAAPQDRHQLVEEQDQAESGEHLVEVIAVVERAQRHDLDRHADHQRPGEAERHAREVRAGPLRGGEHQIRADHVQRAVRQVDEVHDAEHQRQARRHQEQRDAELQSVQQLLEKKGEAHGQKKKGACRAPFPIR